MAVSKKNRVKQKERKKQQHFSHVAFLLEAGDIEGIPAGLRNNYRHIAKKVADKTQVRLDKSYKRTFCQKCGAKFPIDLKIEKQKFGYFKLTCRLCYFTKNIQIKEKVK